MRVFQCETPALLLDIDAAERNIKRMADYFRGKKASLRPHVKVHKSPFLAQKQIRAGAKGVTCATITEAEAMADSGISDILIANEIVGECKLKRLATLANYCQLSVSVDNIENARQISSAASEANSKIGVLVDVNLGSKLEGLLDRCGISPGPPAVQLANEVAKLKNVEFRGLMGYEGSVRKFPEFESRREIVNRALGLLMETKDLIRDSGLNVDVISCGGTSSHNIAGEFPGVTEVQAGTYLFMDRIHNIQGVDFEVSLTVLTSVVSRPRPEKMIIDAGLKAISVDTGLPAVKGMPELEPYLFNAEHGHIRATNSNSNSKIGKQLELLPVHVDTTVCLHNHYTVAREGNVERTLGITC